MAFLTLGGSSFTVVGRSGRLRTPSVASPRRPRANSVAASVGQYDDVLAGVVAAAESAAKHMMEEIGSGVAKTKLNSRDLLTKIDPECQQIIEDYMKLNFDGHVMLGEESVEGGRDESIEAIDRELERNEWLWIVDPIDGTTNFVHGQPLSAVSVGVAHRQKLVVGVIVDPYHRETFAAVEGEGCRLNGKPCHVSKEQVIEDALVGVGSPSFLGVMNAVLRGTNSMMPQVRSMRFLGSAAVMYAWVACGRLTAYWEPDLHSWDSAAGALLVREAGGRVTDFDLNEYTLRTRTVLASNGPTHEPICEILRGAKANVLE